MPFAKCFVHNLLVCLLIHLNFYGAFGTSYTCDTPDDWLSGDAGAQKGDTQEFGNSAAGNLHISKGEPWPNGVVKYKFNHTLTLDDMYEVKKAFEEFHKKTCIRFRPWKEGDVDFVSIEVDDSVCGNANVCKIGGYQFARFGGKCKNKATMIHELGHSICLGHEHQRADRDDYINFRNCSKPPKKLFKTRHAGTYDFASQMHYQCNWCAGGWPNENGLNNCGPNFSQGLSILDVDTINALYNCQGCNRHRWIPLQSLTHADKANMYHFGYESSSGSPLYVCRAVIEWEVTPGVFDEVKKSCNVTIGFTSYNVNSYVEVLTIPGGLNAQCSKYKLVKKTEAIYNNFLRVGSAFKLSGPTIHVAFASRNESDGMVDKAIGKILYVPNENRYWPQAELRIGSETYTTNDYEILTCSLDKECMFEESYYSTQSSGLCNH